MLRLLTSLLLVGTLSSLSGCGGAADEAQDGRALPTAYDMVETYRALDVAIDGDGLFVLQDKGAGQRSYSRLGQFDLDPEGQLIHADGSTVLGSASDSDPTPVPLARAPFSMAARLTTRVALEGSLDARVPVASDPFAPGNWVSYNNTTSATIYVPISSALTLFFRNTSNGDAATWSVRASLDGRVSNAELVLRFNAVGLLEMGAPSVLFVPADDADRRQVIEVDLRGMRLLQSPFSVTNLVKDGYGRGVLRFAAVEPDGRLMLHYDNGQYAAGGRLLLARFTVADLLHRLGKGSWLCDMGCAQPLTGAPGSALLGRIRSGALNTAY